MIPRILAVLLFGLLTVAPLPAKDKPKPAAPRYSVLTVGDTTILLDGETGKSWMFQRPAGPDGPVWIPIERKEAVARDRPRPEVPLIREIDLSKFRSDGYGEANSGRGKGEELKRSYSYPSSANVVPLRVADLKNYFYADAPEQIARQIDPDEQYLLLVWWESWSLGRDKLGYTVHDGKVAFTLEHGLSQSKGKGGDRPWGPAVRLYALRNGVKWSIGDRYHPDEETKEGKREPKGQ